MSPTKKPSSLHNLGENPDRNAAPCPKCKKTDAVRFFDATLGEQMRGCLACKYKNTLEGWDALSGDPEIEAEEAKPNPVGDAWSPPSPDHLTELKEHKTALALKGMRVHECVPLGPDGDQVVRVPGGWIYTIKGSNNFVPDPDDLMHHVTVHH